MQSEVYDVTVRETKPLTAVQIKAQVNLIQQVMEAVMKKDIHYGTIPGTPKPTLYKAGAEKILSTFRIGVDPESEDLSTGDEVRYRVKAKGFDQQTGVLLGIGVGECSSNEEKYKWRRPVCDEEFNETPEDRRREVWKRGNNGNYKIKQIRTNPSDVANTILKMAKKRAQIDLTLTVTAASDVFDQDLEDLPEEMRQEQAEQKAPIATPQKKGNGEQKPQAKQDGDKPAIKDPDAPCSEAQTKAIFAMSNKLGIKDDFEIHKKASRLAGIPGDEVVTSLKDLTKGQASQVIDALNKELEIKK